METAERGDLQTAVQSTYGAVAKSGLSSRDEGVRSVAEAFGYSAEELSSIPAAANMGLSCGNPIAMASLKPGEVVVDLGCGGGLDVFLAAQRVGPTGKAIGIDMTPEMIALAKRNAATAAGGAALAQVEFYEARIDRLPLEGESVDCVTSNCVINLAEDKGKVFREIWRVLRPGGRVAVSDIALKKELPRDLANDIGAFVGCISGAISLEDYRAGLRDAGFQNVTVIDAQVDLNAYAAVENQVGCCSPAMSKPQEGECTTEGLTPVLVTLGEAPSAGGCCGSSSAADEGLHGRLTALLEKYNVNEYAASVKVLAVKPG